MAVYNESIERGDVHIPEKHVKEIIQELPSHSVIMDRARRARMSTKTQKQPVLSALPDAYWVNGDAGLKQTTKAEWSNLTITAEELAALIVVPDAVIDDSDIPIWDEVRPLLVEAIGKKVDEAALFGVDKPASWPTAVVPSAISAGNVVAPGTGEDLGVDVANLAGLIAKDGYSVNGFASAPGLNWEFVAMRTGQGAPIYSPSIAEGQPGRLYGYPFNEVTNGAWDPNVKLLAADWTKFIVGIRQDITFSISSHAVITDDDGKVIVNAYQQDSKIMRVVFRVGFQVAKPLTRIGGASRYPAGVIADGS